MATMIGTQFLPADVRARKDMDIRAGDTVRVYQKIKEKDKTRIQIFEGLVIARKHGAEAGGTFTVRKVTSGVGVERIFPLYSPMLEKVEVIRRAHTRRAKLYFIRHKVARDIRRKLRNFVQYFASSASLSAIPVEDMMEEGDDVVETATETTPEMNTEQASAPEVSEETTAEATDTPTEETQ